MRASGIRYHRHSFGSLSTVLRSGPDLEIVVTDSHHSFEQRIDKKRLGQSGQIVVEYVLLLVIAVIVAALITKTMISPNPDNPGFVLTAWKNVVEAIGADKPDDIKR
jgi:hypothetical protein